MIDKKGILLHEYSQSAILHAPHFRRVVKARTHKPTFAGLALESVLEPSDSSPELGDSTTDFLIVDRLPVSNMFDIYTPIQ